MSDRRSSSIEDRLKSWRDVVETGQPYWLAEIAPKIVRELEDDFERERLKRDAALTHAPRQDVEQPSAPRAQTDV